jgi:hypothetical protein
MDSKVNFFLLLFIIGYSDSQTTFEYQERVVEYKPNDPIEINCTKDGFLIWSKYTTDKQLHDSALNIYENNKDFYTVISNGAGLTTLKLLKPNWTDVGKDVYFAGTPPFFKSGCYISIYFYRKYNTSIFKTSTITI